MRGESTRERIMAVCSEFPIDKYSNFGLNDLMVFAVKLLENNQIPATFENVTFAAHSMFPFKFGLSGYEDMPDSARVNRALLHLTPKYRNWLQGNGSKGYALNDAGREAAAKADAELRSGKTMSRSGGSPRTKYEVEGPMIKSSSAYQKYSRGQPILKWEVFALLGGFPYTPSKQLRRRMNELLTVARDASDSAVVAFLEKVLSDFDTMFSNVSRRD